ncbi:hypothetical protein QEG73_00035 [Chitinophagaceae bacterium 26-R-25]|nr:hypothetical protein [Chitinophagaceae bacterium 26-R-25]
MTTRIVEVAISNAKIMKLAAAEIVYRDTPIAAAADLISPVVYINNAAASDMLTQI